VILSDLGSMTGLRPIQFYNFGFGLAVCMLGNCSSLYGARNVLVLIILILTVLVPITATAVKKT